MRLNPGLKKVFMIAFYVLLVLGLLSQFLHPDTFIPGLTKKTVPVATTSSSKDPQP